jgi:carbon-monoxide dehydrogenase medium subunit
VKPPAFEYVGATSVAEAVAVLASEEDAKVLAGGQSLLPLLALRLARPSRLVDIGRLRLDEIELGPDDSPAAGAYAGGAGGPTLRLGALTRQRRLETDAAVGRAAPLLREAARYVGHPATRNRGTLGGSLAHADPAAELPAVAVALDALVVATGPDGSRQLTCAELVEGYFTTTLEPAEILTEIRVPAAGPRHGAAWSEWAPRAGDFAEVGVGVALELDAHGVCHWVGAAACSVASVPLVLGPALAEAGVVGAESAAPALLRAVAQAVKGTASAAGDDKAELAALLAARSVADAFERAQRNRARFNQAEPAA